MQHQRLQLNNDRMLRLGKVAVIIKTIDRLEDLPRNQEDMRRAIVRHKIMMINATTVGKRATSHESVLGHVGRIIYGLYAP